MYHVPGIEGLHALRDSLGVIVRAKLPIGADGRNRPSLFPFGTATGRNAHSKSLYNAHASMRSFMVFPPDTIGVYLDWRTQEVGIAAALSGDEGLMHDYQTGDVYYALAKLCGLTNDPDQKRWKRENPDVRQRMKSLQLAVNYGMGGAVASQGLRSAPADRQHHHRATPADLFAFLAVARRYGADRHARAPHRERVWLAAAYRHQPEPAHALQFSVPSRRCRNVAPGSVATVRGRHHPKHVDP
jgi:hypothetical protein